MHGWDVGKFMSECMPCTLSGVVILKIERIESEEEGAWKVYFESVTHSNTVSPFVCSLVWARTQPPGTRLLISSYADLALPKSMRTWLEAKKLPACTVISETANGALSLLSSLAIDFEGVTESGYTLPQADSIAVFEEAFDEAIHLLNEGWMRSMQIALDYAHLT